MRNTAVGPSRSGRGGTHRVQRLSYIHAPDLRRLDDLLASDIDERWVEHVSKIGIASETAVRHLLRAAKDRIDTTPAASAAIYAAAATMAASLPDTLPELAAALRGYALKGRANALRLLGGLDEALALLASAADLFASARYCNAEAGQVEYTRATVLFKREHWNEALLAVRAARARFLASNDSRRVAHADLVEAGILFEQGDWDAARDMWLRLRVTLAALHDQDALARVWLNLGACEIRRGDPQVARHWLNRASAAFRSKANLAELTRTRWSMATYLTAFRSRSRGLAALRRVQQSFLTLGMWLDAGCVGLDMTEVMIEEGFDEDRLTKHGLGVAGIFVRAGREERRPGAGSSRHPRRVADGGGQLRQHGS